MTSGGAPAPVRAGYWDQSRRLSMSVLFVLPLVALYQVGIVQSGSHVRNMAELWIVQFISAVGLPAAHVINALIILGFVAAFLSVDKKTSLCLWFMLLMALESVLYAAAMVRGLGLAATVLHHEVGRFMSLGGVNWTPLLVGLGAGVYEELVFRLGLLGGGAYLLRTVSRWSRGASLAVMLVVSSVVFSAVHYVGPLGDSPELFSFLFRALAGLVLGTIFIYRGLGIAAWAHALYNLLVFLVVGGFA